MKYDKTFWRLKMNSFECSPNARTTQLVSRGSQRERPAHAVFHPMVIWDWKLPLLAFDNLLFSWVIQCDLQLFLSISLAWILPGYVNPQQSRGALPRGSGPEWSVRVPKFWLTTMKNNVWLHLPHPSYNKKMRSKCVVLWTNFLCGLQKGASFLR